MEDFDVETCILELQFRKNIFEEQNNQEFRLIKHICAQLTEDYKNSGHPSEPWAGRAFYQFCTPATPRYEFRRKLFEFYFESVCGTSFSTFRTVSSKFVGEETLYNGFCFSAYLNDNSIYQHLVQFFLYLDEPGVKYHFVFSKTQKDLIEKLKVPSENPPLITEDTFKLNLDIPPRIPENLNYFGTETLELLGREKEKEELLSFVTADDNYLWMQVAGEAGQGKSKIALWLVNCLVDSGEWDAGFINEYEDNKLSENIDSWQPSTSTLLVFDYVLGRTQNLRTLFKSLARRQRQLHNKVRILLLEREPFKGYLGSKDKANNTNLHGFVSPWFGNLTERYDGNDPEITDTRYKSGVVVLGGLDENTLLSIVIKLVNRIKKDAPIKDEQFIKSRLSEIDSSGRPLYAYFLAQEIASGSDLTNWTTQYLLDATLSRERIKWWWSAYEQAPPILEDDLPESRIAVLATIISGLDCNIAYKSNALPLIKSKIRERANVLTGGPRGSNNVVRGAPFFIHAMQPDLLGEWYVLSSFQCGLPNEQILKDALKYSSRNLSMFIHRVSLDFRDHPVLPELLERLVLLDLSEDVLMAVVFAAVEIYKKIPKSILTLWNEAVECSEYLRYKMGFELFKGEKLSQSYERSIELLSSVTNFPHADNILGCCYLHGLGTEIEYEMSIRYFTKASQKNFPDAMNNLAICYEQGLGVEQSLDKAFMWYERALAEGNIQAITGLAGIYEVGAGKKADLNKAIDLYLQAAEKNERWALYKVGTFYESGLGVIEKNEVISHEYIKKAAELEVPEAINHIGTLHAKGIVVEQSFEKAFEYYKRAAELDDALAMFNLACCYEKGEGVEKNFETQLYWLLRAGNARDVESMFRLGCIYLTKLQIFDAALYWFEKAYKGGNVQAANNLGYMYENGIGVKKNSFTAFRYIKVSADAEIPEGLYLMGTYYARGIVVEYDWSKAIALYKQSAQMGFKKAKDVLKKLNL